MKNRFLSATTALSVVLASMHPLPVIAQDSRADGSCVPGEGDCSPLVHKKAKEAGKEKREGENRAGASDEDKQARQQKRKEKAREQAQKQEAEEAAERRKERNAERKQAEENRQEERQENREQQAESADRQEAESAAERRKEQNAERKQAEERRQEERQQNRKQQAESVDRQKVEDAARRSSERRQEADRQSEESPLVHRREDNAGDRQARREQREQPSEEEVRRLDRLLDNRDGDGRVEAASDERRQSRRVIERRLTEEDTRSSDEDFRRDRNPRNDNDNNDNDNDDDDDDGLSDLQKFGLLALGGLAVGALLNNNRRVVSNSGDRVVVQDPDGSYTVLRDDDTLIRQPGSDVSTESFNDGSTRTTVTRADGSRIVTIRDASGRVLQRTRINPNGQEVYLIDDLAPVEEVDFSRLPPPDPNFRISTSDNGESLRDALARIEGRDAGRRFSLRQIRDYREVRELAPAIDIAQITFATGSAAIDASEAERLADLGRAITDLIADKPNEMFLIEGHTDAVGSAAANLALSDQRAESVALALTEYFDVPPENLVVQGYGEGDLLIDSDGPELRNRRVAARLITPLLQQAALE